MKVALPMIPNFIISYSDNGNDAPPIPIEDLTDEQIIRICDAWRFELLNKAKRRRKQKKFDKDTAFDTEIIDL